MKRFTVGISLSSSHLVCVLNITCFIHKHKFPINLCVKSQRCKRSGMSCEDHPCDLGDPVAAGVKLQRNSDFSKTKGLHPTKVK